MKYSLRFKKKNLRSNYICREKSLIVFLAVSFWWVLPQQTTASPVHASWASTHRWLGMWMIKPTQWSRRPVRFLKFIIFSLINFTMSKFYLFHCQQVDRHRLELCIRSRGPEIIGTDCLITLAHSRHYLVDLSNFWYKILYEFNFKILFDLNFSNLTDSSACSLIPFMLLQISNIFDCWSELT